MKKFIFSIGALAALSNRPLFAADPFLSAGGETGVLFIFPLLIISGICFLAARRSPVRKTLSAMGFRVITPHKEPRFFPLSEAIANMEPIVEALADADTNVYSNLGKILVTLKPNGVLVEDKNFKNSILVNRRRSRRSFLNDGDIIDMGELTLIFVNPDQKQKKSSAPQFGNALRNNKVSGKLLKNSATLIPSDSRQRTFFLTKNITYIGRSDSNDLVTKIKAVSSRHAKIERVAGRLKLIDLNSVTGTFVNGRRVEEKYLKDGDEVAFESVKYRFYSQGRTRS